MFKTKTPTVCSRCSKEITGLLGGLSFNKQTDRCNKCDGEVNHLLRAFREMFLRFGQDSLLTPDEWNTMTQEAQKHRLDWSESLAYVRGDALNLLERMLAFAAADGLLTQDEAVSIRGFQERLQVPDAVASPLLQRIGYLRHITEIRSGRLETVKPRTGTQLESGELCHLDTDATYVKVGAKTTQQIPGRLIASSKKLVFLSPTGGTEILWKSIMRVERQAGGVYLELTKKSGNGLYLVSDSVLVEAVLDTLTRLAKRQLLVPQEGGESRHIPQDVKIAVWQRDQGKCVQCSANSYLEFDHIIPFSKGGASTINNVQLLCRRCNLAKSNSI